jgi:hypothetical protein
MGRYPDGLSGEAIPLGARIIVADTFDAITSKRTYRPASPHKRAIDYATAVGPRATDWSRAAVDLLPASRSRPVRPLAASRSRPSVPPNSREHTRTAVS